MYGQVVQNKPTAAYVLALLAGVFGLILSLLAIVGLAFLYAALGTDFGFDPDLVTTVLIIGIAIAGWILVGSLLVIIGGNKLRSKPAEHTKWGAVILIFSIIGLGPLALSIPAWEGIVGLIITIMGIVAGILALVFKPVFAPQPYGAQQPQYGQPPTYTPPPPQPYTQPVQPAQRAITRICPQCGRVIDENVKFCPHCGKALG